jgi:hypothetical protein
MRITSLVKRIVKSEHEAKVYKERWLSALELIDELSKENSQLRTLVAEWENK